MFFLHGTELRLTSTRLQVLQGFWMPYGRQKTGVF